ncbi:MAG: lysophospholipid acyltransferase family protein, partial [Nitrospirota bacterium]
KTHILYDTAHALFYILFKIFFGYRIAGRENVPTDGPVILASNHASFLDPPLVGSALWRRVNFVARDTLFNRPWKKFILDRWKAFPLNRDRLDKATLTDIINRLKKGEPVCLFPEGTRSPDGNFLPGKAGIGMIVSMAKVPVVPVYVRGSHLTFGKIHKAFRPTKISVTFGKPLDFRAVAGMKGHERYQLIADEIMEEIKKLKESNCV